MFFFNLVSLDFRIMNFYYLFMLYFTSLTFASRVNELSDKFLEIKKDGCWLVMFYAPWCAHCKRLEPVWIHVAQALYDTDVRVGKIDCTRYTTMPTEFKISGFPTIMLIKGDEEFVFKGDRTKEEIVNFALRVSGPPVQQITKKDSLNMLQDTRRVFFLYVGSYSGSFWDSYYNVAEKFQPYAFFYSISNELVNKHMEVKDDPSILVYKEKTYYKYKAEDVSHNMSLSDWVNGERFNTFMKVTKGNIYQFMKTNKYLVLAVVNENILQEVPEDMMVFRDIIESVIVEHRDKYHRYCQFGWIGAPDLANSIAMQVLELPHLMVINSTTNHHHLFNWNATTPISKGSVISFIDSVLNQTAPVLGGDSWLIRGYRAYFSTKTILYEMWKGNPTLTAVIFGLPMGFLSLIIYSTCCANIMDANPEEEEEEFQQGYSHEKKE